MIIKPEDIRLKVQLVRIGMNHQYYYEGPCRTSMGDALKPEFDVMNNAEVFARMSEEFAEHFEKNLKGIAELLEPMYFGRTDNWDIKESMYEELEKRIPEADFFVFSTNLGTYDIAVEFAERYKVPMGTAPEMYNPAAGPSIGGALASRHVDYEFYSHLEWEEFDRTIRILRARKVLQHTRMLQLVRFNSSVSKSNVDSFPDLTAVSEKFGVRFRQMNAHEFFDQLTPATEEGNRTTPGRKTWDLDEDDIAEAERLADELIANAEDVEVDRKFVVKSAKAHVAIKKQMDVWDCNCFAAPCPDLCSTRRLNEGQFTLCLNHSLMNGREHMASACEYDICAGLTMQLLIALTGQSPYMGNSSPVIYKDGEPQPPQVAPGRVDPAGMPKLTEYKEYVYNHHHSTPHSRFNDPGKDGPYALRHFAYDQGFGAVMRYNFTPDQGKKVTFARIGGDAAKLFIMSAEVICGGGYELHCCNSQVLVKTNTPAREIFKEQCRFGNHLAMVYGDYADDLQAFGEMMGLEIVRF